MNNQRRLVWNLASNVVLCVCCAILPAGRAQAPDNSALTSQPHPELMKRWLNRLESQGLYPERAIATLHDSIAEDRSAAALSAPLPLASVGDAKTLTLLVEYPETPARIASAVIDSKLYGNGDGSFPFESVRAFYRRSSYSKMNYIGTTLGWYRLKNAAAYYQSLPDPVQAIVMEALDYYHSEAGGTLSFAEFDSDGDGYLDPINVIHSGHSSRGTGLNDGYMSVFSNREFTIDGKHLGRYTFEWEDSSNSNTGNFDPRTVIHETGHLLGLPDYYDYSPFRDDGIVGGIGHDMMGGTPLLSDQNPLISN